jgi:hypothetical protein
MRTRPLLSLLVFLALAHEALPADSRGGLVVWWSGYPAPIVRREGTNGVVFWRGEMLTNVVALAAHGGGALLLRNDGEVLGWRTTLNEPCGPITINGQPLTNVAALSGYEGGALAFRRDGTVVECDPWSRNAGVLPGLSNVISVVRVSNGRLLAVRKDGTVLCRMSPAEWEAFAGDSNSAPTPVLGPDGRPLPALPPMPPFQPTPVATVGGHPVTNVVALTEAWGLGGGDCLALKRDGTVLALWLDPLDFGFGGFSGEAHPVTAHQLAIGSEMLMTNIVDVRDARRQLLVPVWIGGEVLTNIVAVTYLGGHSLALKSDGTAVAWGRGLDREALPPGLRGLAAIGPAGDGVLALRRDGTVLMLGTYTNVPAGLSNVTAIAAEGFFCLATTTNAAPPSSVFVEPQGRLEKLEREADLIFKGRVISTSAATNASFPSWGKPHATRFSLVSVLKGHVNTNAPVFWHNTQGSGAWGGGSPPSWHQFEPGQAYLVFAARLDKPDYLYSVPADATNRPNEFRQLCHEGVMRTLDARPVGPLRVKDAHWLELNLLLNDTNATNQLYAIQHLNAMSSSCLGAWGHTEDFRREEVLRVVVPLVTNANDSIAVAAIGCFQLGGSPGTLVPDQGGYMPILRGCSEVRPECVAQVSPYAATLAAVASTSSSTLRRAAAIAACSCTGLPIVRDSLTQWLRDPADEARALAVLLLPDFPGEFSERALRECATDASPKVRAAVADAIGNGTIEALLPTLEALFSAPVGPTNPVPPLTLEELQAGGQLVGQNVGDMHTSAGDALLKFDTDQVSTFLKAKLSDAGFRISFLCKLAEKGVGPWLDDLAAVMESRRTENQRKAEARGADPHAYYFEALMTLSGKYYQCWNIIYNHLHDLPKEQFTGGKMDRYLDVLETAGWTGSREPVMIYELYRMKGLDDRARKFRSQTENKLAVYNIRQFFDKLDAAYTNSPPRSDR